MYHALREAQHVGGGSADRAGHRAPPPPPPPVPTLAPDAAPRPAGGYHLAPQLGWHPSRGGAPTARPPAPPLPQPPVRLGGPPSLPPPLALPRGRCAYHGRAGGVVGQWAAPRRRSPPAAAAGGGVGWGRRGGAAPSALGPPPPPPLLQPPLLPRCRLPRRGGGGVCGRRTVAKSTCWAVALPAARAVPKIRQTGRPAKRVTACPSGR